MHVSLYRKWRPQTFDDVCGQQAVVNALKNEVAEKRVAHAYLFTGTRGTGKTSCAKILAKAVNCPHAQNGNPCNQCATCRGIDNGSILEVVEMDAASNNKVEDIRRVLEEVVYAPAAAAYRVYIIDEVHMLTPSAYNALLKTLEEPPSYVIFILATTELHKIPATVLSRCQRFDFKRLTPGQISDRLTYVARQEGMTLTPGAAAEIARFSDGAMRDALSLLEKCAGTGKAIDEAGVAEAVGVFGRDLLCEFAEACVRSDGVKALSLLFESARNVSDMTRICEQLTELYRDLLILKSAPQAVELLELSSRELEKLRALAQIISTETLFYHISVLEDTLARLPYSGSKRVTMELCTVRLASPPQGDDPAALRARIAALEAKLAGAQVVVGPSAPAVAPLPEKQVQPPVAEQPPVKEEPVAELPPEEIPWPEQPPAEESFSSPLPVAEPAPVQQVDPAPEGEAPFTRWNELRENLRGENPMIGAFLSDATAVLKNGKLCISAAPYAAGVLRDGDSVKLLEKHACAVNGAPLAVVIADDGAGRDPLDELQGRLFG
ncbi:MAG: DNA polymerase III subunit gamma/tau [Clostridia bacterium]|nr:DNA polymerase III subunit gamma/tau [Clostridia bacterium]